MEDIKSNWAYTPEDELVYVDQATGFPMDNIDLQPYGPLIHDAMNDWGCANQGAGLQPLGDVQVVTPVHGVAPLHHPYPYHHPHLHQPSQNRNTGITPAQTTVPQLGTGHLPSGPLDTRGSLPYTSGANDGAPANGAQNSRSGLGEAYLRDPNWTYAVEVQPAFDEIGQKYVANHITAIAKQFGSRGLIYGLVFTEPVEQPGEFCRQYTLPQRDRFNERVRLEFLQIFNAARSYNRQLPGYSFKMSVVFKDRDVLPSGHYPPGLDRHDEAPTLLEYPQADEASLLPGSPSSASLNSPSRYLQPLTPPDGPSTPVQHDNPRPPRLGPIPKPDRPATKNREGKYCCTYPGCTDEVKVFSRKCEWSKHMDKHDRPYKCMAPGCEKLAGFTYSGGLLRHEREVHNKHGGPKNPLNCPHGNCKRHEGKGFSRMENLNEHLRRVHTPNEANNGPAAAQSPEDDLEDGLAAASQASPGGEKTGEKRKPDDDLRREFKRIVRENQELRAKVEAQNRQTVAMMQQMAEMNNRLNQLSNGGVGAASAANSNSVPSPGPTQVTTQVPNHQTPRPQPGV